MENIIDLYSVSDLLKKKFYIPCYQRGYRWTEQQVRELLNDINDFDLTTDKVTGKKNWYCLQPLVVKEMAAYDDRLKTESDKNGWYEVVDGQQRLTTMCLIIRYINEMWRGKGKEMIPLLKYETRSDCYDFLTSLEIIDDTVSCDEKSEEYIDYYFMRCAYETIDNWVRTIKNFNDSEFTSNFIHNTKFIWYQLIEDDPIKVFTRLNVGRIPLTNSELIKALFLNERNFSDKNVHLKQRQQEIAGEWDNIEYELQNEEFWLFLHELGYTKPTRIDLIFDLICEHNVFGKYENIGNDDYKTFRYFAEHFKKIEVDEVVGIWKIIKKYHYTFKEWYNDLTLYHYVGYLIDCEYDVSDLFNKWNCSTDKNAFIKYLKDEIRKCLNLEKYGVDKKYNEDGSNKGLCKSLLLFHNIQTAINQNTNQVNNDKYKVGTFYKFPFHLYKMENWDVEHINSNTTNQEEDEQTQKEWLTNIYLAVSKEMQDDIKKFFETRFDSDEKRNIEYNRIRSQVNIDNNWTQQEKNMVWNYTLLDSSTNRSYGNSIFSAKRRIIIGKDKGVNISVPYISRDGKILFTEEKNAKSSFVPLCTKQIFMKYYSSSVSDINYWTKEDAENYKNDILYCLTKI